MKLTRSTTPKPFKAAKPVAPAKPAQPAQPDDVDFQDVVRMLTDVTQQNKDFAEGLSILTQKVDQIVKSIAEVMKTNKEFCESVIQEISAISEYINIPAEDGESEEAEEDILFELTADTYPDIPSNSADEVALAIYTLCTAVADGITGETLVSDGGMRHNIMSYIPQRDQYPEEEE